ncbi:MAG: Sister chromatid cohesion protein 2 [Bathelium mastoideum]|nr:MAG: Sister chromatid cohesion protein 2 [Bathelium mastoideum]
MNTLLNSLTSESASLKNRGLKSVTQLLDSNESILDRKDIPILQTFFRCLSDNSSLVRDSALNLIGKCLLKRPGMDRNIYSRLIPRAGDSAASVRKRCIKLLKEIYLRNEDQDMRSSIAEALLQRMTDTEESVCELCRQTFEEIWFTPYIGLTSVQDLPAQKKVAFENHAVLVVKTAQRGNSASHTLESLVKSLLVSTAKNSAAMLNVCKELVATMVDAVIENSTNAGRPSPADYLQTLTVFAKARPKLFSAKQLEVMQPYIQNLQTNDDRPVFRAVLVIYRWVFPYLSSMQHDFLKAVHTALLENLSKLTKMDLDEAALCLWTIDSVIKNTTKLARMASSVLQQLHSLHNANLGEEPQNKMAQKVSRLLNIAGSFFHVCDFDEENGLFKERFPQWDGKSVATLVINVIRPYVASKQPLAIRDLSLETICKICRSWPKQYLRPDISNIVEGVFRSPDRRLQLTALSGIKELFVEEEKRSESGAEIAVGEGIVNGAERLGKSLQANENDGVATTIAQQLLQYILRIALASQDELATTAAQIVASVNRQGLVHPKETGVALVALETSPTHAIATIAFQEHRNLNLKHESVFDKEYVKAVYEAFLYQRDTVKNVRGATPQPHASKLRLTFEVLKLGNGKGRKKFLANMVSRINFDLNKLDISSDPPVHLMFARFSVENLAFFDYSRVDEILHLLDCMEKTVATTGTGIAHAIETDMQRVQLGSQSGENEIQVQNAAGPTNTSITDQRLRQLTVGSMILSLIWETRTFIRRLWGLQKQRDGKNKTSIKDLNKAPTKAQGVSGDRYWEKTSEIMASLDSREAMVEQCRAFAKLLSIDDEVKVASDDEEADLAKAAAGYETPSDDGNSNGSAPPSTGKGRKRKGSASLLATPSKPKKRGRPSVSKRKSGSAVAGDEDADWD